MRSCCAFSRGLCHLESNVIDLVVLVPIIASFSAHEQKKQEGRKIKNIRSKLRRQQNGGLNNASKDEIVSHTAVSHWDVTRYWYKTKTQKIKKKNRNSAQPKHNYKPISHQLFVRSLESSVFFRGKKKVFLINLQLTTNSSKQWPKLQLVENNEVSCWMKIRKVINDSPSFFSWFPLYSNPYSSLIFYRSAKFLTSFLILLQGLTKRKTPKLEYKNCIAVMDSSIHILTKAWHRKRIAEMTNSSMMVQGLWFLKQSRKHIRDRENQ